jgi:hypothetical protein
LQDDEGRIESDEHSKIGKKEKKSEGEEIPPSLMGKGRDLMGSNILMSGFCLTIHFNP